MEETVWASICCHSLLISRPLQGALPPHLASVSRHACRVLSSVLVETSVGHMDVGTHSCLRQVEGEWVPGGCSNAGYQPLSPRDASSFNPACPTLQCILRRRVLAGPGAPLPATWPAGPRGGSADGGECTEWTHGGILLQTCVHPLTLQSHSSLPSGKHSCAWRGAG